MPGEDNIRLLRGSAVVTRVENGMAQVEGNPSSACGHCSARSGCSTATLMQLMSGRKKTDVSCCDRREISLPFSGDIQPGDEVEVTIPSGQFLGAAGLAYLLPPLVLVLAAAGLSAAGLPDWLTALAMLPILALSLVPLRLAERKGAALKITRVLRFGGQNFGGQSDEA